MQFSLGVLAGVFGLRETAVASISSQGVASARDLRKWLIMTDLLDVFAFMFLVVSPCIVARLVCDSREQYPTKVTEAEPGYAK